MTALTAFGPGKVILLGEHGVVYGHPAIAVAISRGVTARAQPSSKPGLDVQGALTPAASQALTQAFQAAVELTGKPSVQVQLSSELPLSMGLGSSGAVSVAVARLLVAARWSRENLESVWGQHQVEKVALAMEKVFHGRPSGLDHTTSARGGLLWFKAGKARPLPNRASMSVVVCLSGQRPPTKTLVAELRARQQRWPTAYRRLFAHIGQVVGEGAQALKRGDAEAFGDAMNRNHGLLAALQVSGARVEALVHRLRELGALGAKLTGAGGDGGAVIGLFRSPVRALKVLQADGISCFASPLPRLKGTM